MITITWTCEDCGSTKATKAEFDDYKVEAYPPIGWGACVEPQLRCTECMAKRRRKLSIDEPGYIAS